MGRLELKLDLEQLKIENEKFENLKKEALKNGKNINIESTIGGPIFQNINRIRRLLEPAGYSVGIPADSYRGVPIRIIIKHPEKSYNEIAFAFDTADCRAK